jgi:hypothetical protein
MIELTSFMLQYRPWQQVQWLQHEQINLTLLLRTCLDLLLTFILYQLEAQLLQVLQQVKQ